MLDSLYTAAVMCSESSNIGLVVFDFLQANDNTIFWGCFVPWDVFLGRFVPWDVFLGRFVPWDV